MQSSVLVETESPRITELSCKAHAVRAVPTLPGSWASTHTEKEWMLMVSPSSQVKLTCTFLGTTSACVSCQARE